jgi:hypothetical protein
MKTRRWGAEEEKKKLERREEERWLALWLVSRP